MRAPAERVAVLVASCDAYADLWDPFFTLFRRYWPDCPYPVYLGSNHLTRADDVRPLAIGEDVGWSEGFAAMLRRIGEPIVIVVLEDYLLTRPADTARISRLIDFMVDREAACMRLMPVPGPPEAEPSFPDAGELPRGMPYRLSLQAAAWRRETLLGLIRPGESPWEFEVRGTPRTDGLNKPFFSVVRNRGRPLPYFCTAVWRGIWLRDAVRLCRREGVAVDLAARPQESRVDYAKRRLKRLSEELAERLPR